MKTLYQHYRFCQRSMLWYDNDGNLFRLSNLLPAGMSFPYDFWFINHVPGQAGDPLDVMIVISEFKSFTGYVMDCRTLVQLKYNKLSERAQKCAMTVL